MAKLMSPNTTILWLKPDATFLPFGSRLATALIADIASSKAINISQAVATGYTLGPTESDTDDSKTITDESNSASRGNGNYEANLPFYLEADPITNTTSAFLIAFNLFKTKQVPGTLIKRIGYKHNVAFAAGQDISSFSVLTGSARITEQDAGGPIRFEVPFHPQGQMLVNRALL